MILLRSPVLWEDLIDRRFDRLVALGYTGARSKNGRQKYITCRCDCGNTTHVAPTSLRNGATTSCGCRRSEVCAARNVASATHGEARGGQVSREYAAWRKMMDRCDSQHEAADHYAKRGIKVCERWLTSFENFLADVGRRPSVAHSLDRIDNDGDYEPGNVRWATATEQVRNRRNVQRFELDGESLTLAEWAERTGVPLHRLDQRVRRGWSLEKAISTPVERIVDDLRGRWHAIISRCTDPEHGRFADYGGRGITVCDRWRESFDAFVEDVGFPPTPEQYTLDRIDNERGYEPGNVRWTTPTVQSRNKRSSKLYEINGQKKLIIDWCRSTGADYGTVKRRMHVGWSLEEALYTPRNAGRSVKNRRTKP